MMYITLTEGTTQEGPEQAFDYTRIEFIDEASVTEHPVETGAVVSDHVQRRPRRFVADLFVTSSPLSPVEVPFAINRAAIFLAQAIGQRAEVYIEGEETFRDVVLESVSHARTASGGRAFVCRFRQIRIAQAMSVPIPARVPAPVAAVGAPTEAALGQQATTAVPDTSALSAIRGAALSMLGLGG